MELYEEDGDLSSNEVIYVRALKYCVKLFVQIQLYMDVQEFELHVAVTWGAVINQKIQTNKVRDTDRRFPHIWRLIIS